MTEARVHRATLAAVAIAIAAAAAFLFAGWNLPAGVFEPIGSGAVPNGVAILVVVLSLLVAVQAVVGLRRGSSEQGVAGELWGPVVGVFAWTLAYAAVLSTGALRYQWATLVYLPIAILIVAPERRAALPWALGLGAVFAFGLDYVFRRVLVADIP